MVKAKLKARKTTKGRSRAMANDEQNEIQQNGEPPQGEGPEIGPTGPPPAQGVQPPVYAPAPPVDRNYVLLLAATMFTKPGPGTLREAFQHAKNLIQMLEEDEAAENIAS